MKPVGVLRFLGTNCDFDIVAALDDLKISNRIVWWADRFDIQDYSGFVLPGGFSYGDYLRAGAIAARKPAMLDVASAADKGLPILGICNGFQILCEAGLLPGALTRNLSQKFQDEWVVVSKNESFGVWNDVKGLEFSLPIAHGLGRYVASDEEIQKLFENGQVLFRYNENPNGSVRDIAGVVNESGNVAALMPHPERAMHTWMGSNHGRKILEVFR